MFHSIRVFRSWNFSIQAKMAIAMVSLTTLILAGFGFYQYTDLKSRDMARLKNLAEITVERLALNLADPVWNFIPELFEDIVRSEMREQNIYAIRVTGDESIDKAFIGKQRNQDWQIVDFRGNIPADEVFSINRDIIKDKKIGTVELCISLKFMRAELQRELQRLLAIILVLDIALLLFVLITIRLLFIRPITQSLKIANAVAEGDFSHEITIRKQDELGRLAQAFRNMTTSISQVLQETNRHIRAVQNGQLQTRGNPDMFTGGWKELMMGMNNVIEAFVDPITMIAGTLDRVSHGDVTSIVTKEYQGDFNLIITSLNNMIQTLHSVVVQVKSASDHVASNSQEINARAENLSQGATQQAAAAEEVSSSMQQIVANITQSMHNALETKQIAMKSARKAEGASKAVNEMVAAMKQIAQKTAIIQEIAAETHMLSLNATIEAAKAQEYGKGFGVVASQVRTLAERSRGAAVEITELVKSSLKVSKKAGKRLHSLLPDIQKTSQLVQEISSASTEQQSGVTHINDAIHELHDVIQHNATTAEVLASMAENLEKQAVQLQQAIQFFMIDAPFPHGLLPRQNAENTSVPDQMPAVAP